MQTAGYNHCYPLFLSNQCGLAPRKPGLSLQKSFTKTLHTHGQARNLYSGLCAPNHHTESARDLWGRPAHAALIPRHPELPQGYRPPACLTREYQLPCQQGFCLFCCNPTWREVCQNKCWFASRHPLHRSCLCFYLRFQKGMHLDPDSEQ